MIVLFGSHYIDHLIQSVFSESLHGNAQILSDIERSAVCPNNGLFVQPGIGREAL